MSKKKQPLITSGEMKFLMAIGLGLVIGILIKKIKIGIFLGLIIGIVVVISSWFRLKRK